MFHLKSYESRSKDGHTVRSHSTRKKALSWAKKEVFRGLHSHLEVVEIRQPNHAVYPPRPLMHQTLRVYKA